MCARTAHRRRRCGGVNKRWAKIPCLPGDMVYVVSERSGKIIQGEVTSVHIMSGDKCHSQKSYALAQQKTKKTKLKIPFSDFGVKAFLSEKEAVLWNE